MSTLIEKTKRVVVLFSGGLDSSVLLYHAKANWIQTIAVSVVYGQKNSRELNKAMEMCTRLGVDQRVTFLGMGQFNSALTGSQEGGRFGGVSEWYVPNRNFIFVGMAAAVAEAEGIDTIWYGATADSLANGFPDCSQDWIDKVNAVLSIGLSFPIRLEAPLLHKTKDQIRELAKTMGIRPSDVHSGYDV